VKIKTKERKTKQTNKQTSIKSKSKGTIRQIELKTKQKEQAKVIGHKQTNG
jgi:hypothetical protein